MTDRDRELQRVFDRHLRGEGPPPDTSDDPEASAYKVIYATLGEEPEGELSNDFAYQVADRVDLSAEPGMGWIEIVVLLVVIAGAGAGLVSVPPTAASVQQTIGEILMTVQDVSASVRLDVVIASALVLIVTVGFDQLLRRLRPGHSIMSL